MRLLLCPVAAHLHLAPAAALVLGGVEEEPAAMLAGALLDARQVGLRERRQRREGDGAEDRLDDPVLGMPDPGEVGLVRGEPRLGNASCVGMCERVDVVLARPLASGTGDAD